MERGLCGTDSPDLRRLVSVRRTAPVYPKGRGELPMTTQLDRLIERLVNADHNTKTKNVDRIVNDRCFTVDEIAAAVERQRAESEKGKP